MILTLCLLAVLTSPVWVAVLRPMPKKPQF
jgi:hypothetical protein